MRTYMISYDLAQPTRNQHVLAQMIMGLGDKWARPLSSTWYVTSEREEVELESELRDMLGDDDGLVIQAIKREAAMTNTSLRWFRQRRTNLEGRPDSDGNNIVAFPTPQVPAVSAPNTTTPATEEPELPFAEAC